MNPKRLRAIALAEWRGLGEQPLVPTLPRSIADTVQKVMNQMGLKDRFAEEEILQAWREVVGEFVANQSSPKRLKHGVLYVSVLQPTVRYELDRIWKRDILAKLKARFGARAVKEIRFGM